MPQSRGLRNRRSEVRTLSGALKATSGALVASALTWSTLSSAAWDRDTAGSGRREMIGILIAVLVAALVYWLCLALGLPAIVAIVAAILVLLAGVTTGGYGYGSRWGRRRGPPPY